jgi:hypothetical protein
MGFPYEKLPQTQIAAKGIDEFKIHLSFGDQIIMIKFVPINNKPLES